MTAGATDRGAGDPVRATGEQAAQERLAQAGLAIDREAHAAVSNLYRAAAAARNHFERTVLSDSNLTWTSWVVLWVVWVAGEAESRVVAEEAGISKATLTGVARTLQARGLVERRPHPADGRRVLLSPSAGGLDLMQRLVPRFNAHESWLCAGLDPQRRRDLAASLRELVATAETAGGGAAGTRLPH